MSSKLDVGRNFVGWGRRYKKLPVHNTDIAKIFNRAADLLYEVLGD
jgi:hypothetical protein